MPRYWLIVLLLLGTGCDADRIARLEKQNQEIQGQINRQQAAIDYDLQAKCAKDAKTWFNESWSRDKNTILLDYTNHYNKTQNKCFILVQYNWMMNPQTNYVSKTLTLRNIYENQEYARGLENLHLLTEHDKPFLTCSIANQEKEIKTLQDCFNLIYTAYMTN